MSKLLDIFEKIERGSPTPLGFGTSTRVEKVPPMPIIGMVSKDHNKAVSTLLQVKADGVLIQNPPIGNSWKKIIDTLGGVPWGLRLQEVTEETAANYRQVGCDFLAVDLVSAHLGALGDKDTAYFVYVTADMDECTLRAIQELPVDGVLLSISTVELPITLQNTLSIGMVRGNTSKYLLLEVPTGLSTKELEVLRDMGVDGLVVNMSTASKQAFSDLRGGIMGLPKKRRTREGKPAAVAPQPSGSSTVDQPPDEEEEF